MTADAPFLTAIHAAPDDDLPRLAYADWLDEHGHADRAEFIRVQCELARLAPDCIGMGGGLDFSFSTFRVPSADPRWPALARREAELFAALGLGDRDAPAVGEAGSGRRDRWHHRGFTPGFDVASFESFLAFAADGLPPGVTRLDVEPARGLGDAAVRRLLALPGVDRLTALSVRVTGDSRDECRDVLRALKASARLGRLRHLYLSPTGDHWPAGPEVAGWLHDLLRSPAYRSLEVLELPRWNLGGEQLTELMLGPRAFPPGSPRPRAFGGEGVSELLSHLPLPALTHLNLYASELTPTDGPALAESPVLAGLRVLNLTHNMAFGAAGVEALFAGRGFPHLRGLNLTETECGPGGARALAAAPSLSRLTCLGLYWDHVGDEGAAALAASPHLHDLRYLCLASNGLTDAGARALVDSPTLDRIERLVLEDGIGPRACAALRARYGDRAILCMTVGDGEP